MKLYSVHDTVAGAIVVVNGACMLVECIDYLEFLTGFIYSHWLCLVVIVG